MGREVMRMETKDDWLAHVTIRGSTDGRTEIYIDGKRVNGVVGYKVEHNSSDKRLPILTMQVQCDLEMDSGAIPLLPEPWSWFYEPKVPNFVDGHQFCKKPQPEDGSK
jgi:hypothetical protein